MPELPDLEVIREVLDRRVVGQRIVGCAVLRPLVVRVLDGQTAPEEFLVGAEVDSVARRGKFLLLGLSEARQIAIQPMLAGRLRISAGPSRRLTRDYMVLSLSDCTEIVYHDTEGMGKVYLTRDLDAIPGYGEMGPEPFDPDLTEDAFVQRLRQFRGEIKGVLTRGALVAGIGNAYADEILFEAGIYPNLRCTRLTRTQRADLYRAMRTVLQEAIETVRQRMGEDTNLHIRDFLKVHGRKGQPCPRCGNTISEINVGGRGTNFCRACQPGTMFG